MRADGEVPPAWVDPSTHPEFELACLFDDVDDPSQVTVFYPTGERTVTEWITADLGATVSVDDVR